MSYRDDTEALRARCAEIEHELETLRTTQERLEGLAQRRAKLQGELELLLARERRGKRLPLLDRVYVASPCPVKWTDMVGDDRVRFCAKCEKDVYDLSAMTRTEAERLLRERHGSLCATFYRRADGTILTSDCPVGVRRNRRRRLAAAAIAATAAVAAGGLYASARARQGYPTGEGRVFGGVSARWRMEPVDTPTAVPGEMRVGGPPLLEPTANEPARVVPQTKKTK